MEDINREAARGVERVVIESFPIFSYTLVKRLKSQANCSDCAVCLRDFAEDEMLRLLPKCSHAFHPECIDGWLFTHTTCPVCRTSLMLSDQDIPTATDFGLVEQQSLPGEVTVVVNGTGGIFSNDETTNEASGCDSMVYSLVRVRKETEQPSEWYIATAEGLTPGLHGSCGFLGSHHLHEPSGLNALPACSKPSGFAGDGGHGSRSERWGRISMKPALVLRTFSERFMPRARGQVGAEQQDNMA
ncbi:RING-H2 finger protein ATL64-like [Cryptomeria japonica]|uniref:RING-H2 finger protein ATL64-like n=1 Tax=Cryptomeria japonica TaxID=3369 RepID=UPI0027DA2662|nr:RING-H2 finger protein ATL64-like [Cryptomeria japonica]